MSRENMAYEINLEKIIGAEKKDYDYAINIVYEVCDSLWDINEEYRMGDWCNDSEVKNITKNFAWALDNALKIFEKERK